MKPRIGDHDYQILLKRTMQFLSEGDKIKVTVRFRGRENERPELGYSLVRRLVDDVGDYATVEQSPQKDGRTMSGVLAPTAAAKALDKEGVRRFLNGEPIDQRDDETEAEAEIGNETDTEIGTDAETEIGTEKETEDEDENGPASSSDEEE